MSRNSPITNKKIQEKIVRFWRSRKNNSIPDIAKRYGLSEGIVNRIINNHITKKQ